MRIAYCIKSLHQAGGMERVITAKANYLAGLGYEVFILTTDQQGRAPFFALDSSIGLIDLDVNYDAVDTSSRLRKYVGLAKHKRLHRERLERKLKELALDITISTGYQEFSFLPSLKDGSIKITECHGSWANTVSEHRFPASNYLRRLMSIYAEYSFAHRASRYARCVLLTHEDASLWGGRLGKIEVIPNVMPISSDVVAPLDAKRCIVVARFSHEKNLSAIIDVWAKVARSYPEWRLDLYGGGYLHDSLSRQIDDLGIGGSCALHASTSEIIKEYLSSSVLLMTSQTEGLPMVLLEAQELGLPSVCYAFHCGPKDVLLEAAAPCGFVVPYGDKDAFAERLEELMRDADLRKRMGQAARQNASRFYADVVLPKWDALFRSLVSSKK